MLNFGQLIKNDPASELQRKGKHEGTVMRHYFQDRSVGLAKRGRTRSALIDGAIATIAERGVAGASIKEITIQGRSFERYLLQPLRRPRRADPGRCLRRGRGHHGRNCRDGQRGSKKGLGKIVISTDAFIRRAVEMPDWAALIVSVSSSVGTVRRDLGKHLRADVAHAQKQGSVRRSLRIRCSTSRWEPWSLSPSRAILAGRCEFCEEER